MRKNLSEQVQNDPEFLKEPTAFLEWINTLPPDAVEKLVHALRTRNVEDISAITGLSANAMASAFKTAVERAEHLVKKYPDLDSLRKDDQ